jgi:hypothetical protein
MITVSCDICRENIGTSENAQLAKQHFEPNEIEHGGIEEYFRHVCTKCINAFKKLTILDVLRKAVLDNRTDIPKQNSV